MNWLDFIVSPYGQWEHPLKPTAVPTKDGRITMQGVPYPVMGFVPGQPPIIMQPGGKYQFPGKMVYEIPMAYGGDISIPDLSRPNWLYKAQFGLNYTPEPTREDSLELLNNSNMVLNYYNSKNYDNYSTKYLTNDGIKERNFAFIDEAHKKFDPNKTRTTPTGPRTVPLNEYYKPVDKNKFYQRETSYGILDTTAPMQLYDRRILPTTDYTYKNIKKGDLLFGDAVQIYGYDPLSITPWDMLTEDQKKLRVERFGRDGVPEDYNPDKTAPSIKTPTQESVDANQVNMPQHEWWTGRPVLEVLNEDVIPEDRRRQKPTVVNKPPDFRHGGWQEKYQSDEKTGQTKQPYDFPYPVDIYQNKNKTVTQKDIEGYNAYLKDNQGKRNIFYDTHDLIQDKTGNYSWQPKRRVDYQSAIQGTPLGQMVYKTKDPSWRSLDQFGNQYNDISGLEMGYAPYNIWAGTSTGIGLYPSDDPANILMQMNFADEYPTVYFLNNKNYNSAPMELWQDYLEKIEPDRGKWFDPEVEKKTGKALKDAGYSTLKLNDSRHATDPRFRNVFGYDDDLLRIVNPEMTVAGALPLNKRIVNKLGRIEKRFDSQDFDKQLRKEEKIKKMLLRKAGVPRTEENLKTLMHYNFTPLDVYSEINKPGYESIYPEQKYGGAHKWLDKFQGDTKGSQINYTYSPEFGTMLPEVEITAERPYDLVSVPGGYGSMVTAKRYKDGTLSYSPETAAAMNASNEIARSNNIDPITLGLAAGAAPIGTTATKLLPWLNVPATVGSTTLPGVTAGNILGTIAGYHGAQMAGSDIDSGYYTSDAPMSDKVLRGLETGLNLLGTPGAVEATAAGLSSLGTLGKFATTKTPLQYTYKINPWAEKLANPNRSYRVAGMDAGRDFEATGILRSNPTIVRANLSEGILGTRTTPFPSFQKGYADLRYLPEEGGVIFETDLPTFKRGEINPVTGNKIRGSHYAHRAIDPTTGKVLTEIPSENVRMFGSKPNWLRGYKLVDTPKQLPGSSNKFRSQINWSEWNPETPNHPELINEYNAIEESAKRSGDWMKRIDGKKWKPSPEAKKMGLAEHEYIIHSSSRFKKAYPEGYETTYRGQGTGTENMGGGNRGYDPRIVFTGDKDVALSYATRFSNSKKHSGDLYRPGISDPTQPSFYKLIYPKTNNYKTIRGKGSDWSYIKNPEIASAVHSEPTYGITTEDIAKYALKNNLDYININNIPDYGSFYDLRNYVNNFIRKGQIYPDVKIMIQSPNRYLKSAIGNVGFFDMNNPNIYKALVPGAIAGTASALQKQKYGGPTKWLDKYQGDEGPSQVERRDPNVPFFPSATEQDMYESQYSQPAVTITPNWTAAELERNRLRDKYIADDKKVWRHWYDKLGYDKDNVTKRANQFAYNKLAKEYLKRSGKDNLTPEQRRFVERSEYAGRLQPNIGQRFAQGLKQTFDSRIPNSGINFETLGNVFAPFEYPTNLVRGAIMGDFKEALRGETPSPYFVSSDLAGTSPTEAAITSGLMTLGTDPLFLTGDEIFRGIGQGTRMFGKGLMTGTKKAKQIANNIKKFSSRTVGNTTKAAESKPVITNSIEYSPNDPLAPLGESETKITAEEYAKLVQENPNVKTNFKDLGDSFGDSIYYPATREGQQQAFDEGVDFHRRWFLNDPKKHDEFLDKYSKAKAAYDKDHDPNLGNDFLDFNGWAYENGLMDENGSYIYVDASHPKRAEFDSRLADIQRRFNARDVQNQIQTKNFENAKKELFEWANENVDPHVKEKIENIYRASGKEMPTNSGIESLGNRSKNKLIHFAEKESMENLSDSAKEYLREQYNNVGGVYTDGQIITLGSKPNTVYTSKTYNPFQINDVQYIPESNQPIVDVTQFRRMIKPEDIGDIAAHEGAHDWQYLYNFRKSLEDPNYFDYGYKITSKDNPLGQRLREAMVEPKLLSERTPWEIAKNREYSYDTWLGNYGELHSEMMKARNRLARTYMKDYNMSLDEAVTAIKQVEKEDPRVLDYYLETENINKHFKPTTSVEEKRSILKEFVPVAAPLTIGLGAAAALKKEKHGGSHKWLDLYLKKKKGGVITTDNQDYNYIKYKDLSLSRGTGWLDNYK